MKPDFESESITTYVDCGGGARLSVAARRRIDPTQTVLIRRLYEREMNARFRGLKRLIRDFLIENAVGLIANEPLSRDASKVNRFIRWIKRQSDFAILDGTTLESAGSKSWQNIYIRSAYQKGLAAAATQMKRAGADIRDSYIQSAFFRPIHADRAGLIYTKAFSSLEGISKTMETQLSQTLARGLIEGQGIKQIAREVLKRVDVSAVRARAITQTEVISAHAEASLNSYKEAQLEEVEVLSEFTATLDNKVCEKCRSFNGTRYTIEKARGVIPVHVNCRCAWLPVIGDARGVVLS